MRVLHWRVAHKDHVLFAVNSTVERPGFHFCEGSARATSGRLWCKYFFELAISTRTFRALYAEGGDGWRAIDA